MAAAAIVIEDADLARAAAGGAGQAAEELARRWGPRLLRFFAARGHADPDAEDLAQDTLLRVLRHLGRYDTRRPFATWIFTIGHRLALNRRRDRRPHLGWDEAGEPAAPAAATPDPGGLVWRLAASELDERSHRLLWLRYVEEQPLAEAAVVLGISETNAKVILHRARVRLGRLLATRHPDLAAAPA